MAGLRGDVPCLGGTPVGPWTYGREPESKKLEGFLGFGPVLDYES